MNCLRQSVGANVSMYFVILGSVLVLNWHYFPTNLLVLLGWQFSWRNWDRKMPLQGEILNTKSTTSIQSILLLSPSKPLRVKVVCHHIDCRISPSRRGRIKPLFLAQTYDWSNNAAFYPLLLHRQKQDSYDSDVHIAPIGYRVLNPLHSHNLYGRSLWELSSIKLLNPPSGLNYTGPKSGPFETLLKAVDTPK